MLTINYGIRRFSFSEGRNVRNGTLIFLDKTEKDWEDKEFHKLIRKKIQKVNPGYSIEGYAMKTEIPKFPSDNCPQCSRIYSACKECGNCEPLEKVGEYCKCGRGVLLFKESKFCCQRDWHHLGTTCNHCGQEGENS